MVCQIWQYSKYESRKPHHSFIGRCFLVIFVTKFSFFKDFFFKNREPVTEYLIFQNILAILPQIITCRHIGDHPQEQLTKFGYRSQRKVIIFSRTLLYFGDLLEPIV
jgi:hypothetical protein